MRMSRVAKKESASRRIKSVKLVIRRGFAHAAWLSVYVCTRRSRAQRKIYPPFVVDDSALLPPFSFLVFFRSFRSSARGWLRRMPRTTMRGRQRADSFPLIIADLLVSPIGHSSIALLSWIIFYLNCRRSLNSIISSINFPITRYDPAVLRGFSLFPSFFRFNYFLFLDYCSNKWNVLFIAHQITSCRLRLLFSIGMYFKKVNFYYFITLFKKKSAFVTAIFFFFLFFVERCQATMNYLFLNSSFLI